MLSVDFTVYKPITKYRLFSVKIKVNNNTCILLQILMFEHVDKRISRCIFHLKYVTIFLEGKCYFANPLMFVGYEYVEHSNYKREVMNSCNIYC